MGGSEPGGTRFDSPLARSVCVFQQKNNEQVRYLGMILAYVLHHVGIWFGLDQVVLELVFSSLHFRCRWRVRSLTSQKQLALLPLPRIPPPALLLRPAVARSRAFSGLRRRSRGRLLRRCLRFLVPWLVVLALAAVLRMAMSSR